MAAPKAPKHFPDLEEVQTVIVDSSYQGWCTYCGDWTHDSAEPDTNKYKCPVCEHNTVYGAEELLILGFVT